MNNDAGDMSYIMSRWKLVSFSVIYQIILLNSAADDMSYESSLFLKIIFFRMFVLFA